MIRQERNVRLLRWFNFFLDFEPYNPIAVIYFAQVSGSYALGLSVFAVRAIAAAIFEVPTGVLSDWLGRRKTLIAGSFASLLGVCGFAFANDFWMLVVGAIFLGLAVSLFSGNNEALIYDTLKVKGQDDQYAEVLGKVNAMFQVGLAVSAFIGGFLADWSLQFVFIIAIVPQLICLILSFFFVEPEKHYQQVETNIYQHMGEALKGFVQNWKLRDLSLTAIISFGIGQTMHNFVPAFFATLWPTWALGIPRTLTYGLGAASYNWAGAMFKRFGIVKLLLGSSIYNRVINVLAYGLPTIFSPLLVASGSLTYGLFMVGESTLMQREFTNQQRATMASLNSLFGNIFFAIFAYCFGLFADNWGVATSLLVGELLLLVLIPIYIKLLKLEVRS